MGSSSSTAITLDSLQAFLDWKHKEQMLTDTIPVEYNEPNHILNNNGYAVVKREDLKILFIDSFFLWNTLLRRNQQLNPSTVNKVGSLKIVNDVKERLSQLKQYDGTRTAQQILVKIEGMINKSSFQPQNSVSTGPYFTKTSQPQLFQSGQPFDEGVVFAKLEQLEQQYNSTIESLNKKALNMEQHFSTQKRNLENQHQIEIKKIMNEKQQLEADLRHSYERISQLETDLQQTQQLLNTLKESMRLMNSGTVINSQTQEVLETCNKRMSAILDKVFDLVCLQCDLPEDGNYEAHVHHAIFHSLIVEKQWDHLQETAWNLVMKMVQNTDPSRQQALSNNENLFKTIITMVMDLVSEMGRVQFPKISFAWIGQENIIYTPDMFDIEATETVQEHDQQSGKVEYFATVPALVLGNDKKVERKGKVVKRIFQQ